MNHSTLIPFSKIGIYEDSEFSIRGIVTSVSFYKQNDISWIVELEELQFINLSTNRNAKVILSFPDNWEALLQNICCHKLIQVQNPTVLRKHVCINVENEEEGVVPQYKLGFQNPKSTYGQFVYLLDTEESLLNIFPSSGAIQTPTSVQRASFGNIEIPFMTQEDDDDFKICFRERGSPRKFSTVLDITNLDSQNKYNRYSIFGIVVDCCSIWKTRGKGVPFRSQVTIVDESSFQNFPENDPVCLQVYSFVPAETLSLPFRCFGDIIRVDRALLDIYEDECIENVSSRQLAVKNFSTCLLWENKSETFRPTGILPVWESISSTSRSMKMGSISIGREDKGRIRTLRRFFTEKLVKIPVSNIIPIDAPNIRLLAEYLEMKFLNNDRKMVNFYGWMDGIVQANNSTKSYLKVSERPAEQSFYKVTIPILDDKTTRELSMSIFSTRMTPPPYPCWIIAKDVESYRENGRLSFSLNLNFIHGMRRSTILFVDGTFSF